MRVFVVEKNEGDFIELNELVNERAFFVLNEEFLSSIKTDYCHVILEQ